MVITGRIEMPGAFMSTIRKVMPSCGLRSGPPVRTSVNMKSACWASEVHSLLPLTT